MSGEQLGEIEADRLDAAVFEQRRLSHMLRRRGAEIDALTAERDRLEAERARLAADATEAGAREDELRRRVAELEREIEALGRRLQETRAETERARYEARRAERRLGKADRSAAEAQRQYRLQLDALSAELRVGLESRDEALAAGERIAAERDEALAELPEVEREARDLGRAEIEVERLLALEREREATLAECDAVLGEAGEHLRRVRASRSWRWGQAVSRALRALSLRRRSTRSALDVAIERLEADGERARGEHSSA